MISLLQQAAPIPGDSTATTTTTTVPITPAPAGDATPSTAPAAATQPLPGPATPDTTIAATDAGHAVATGPTVHDVAAATGHAPEAATGMPQLDVTTFANQIFWLVLTLIALWWILSRIALPRIHGVLADRQNAITGDLGAAEEFKRKAREAEEAYDRALATARGEAQGIAAEQKAAAQVRIDAAIAHADAEIAARASESERRIGEIRAGSLEDARSVAREVTAELVRAFGGQADDAAVAAAVDRRLQGAVQ